MTDLSVITVTHQSADYIEELISSVLLGALKHSVEHWIVDNASTDGTVERIDPYRSYVKLIKNEDNRGFSAANNQAFAQAKGKYVLFLNPDMKVEEGSLDQILDWMEQHPEAGIVSCRLVDPQGALMPHRCPHPELQWWREALRLVFPSVKRPEQGLDLEGREPIEVETVIGAFMLVRRDLLEKLGFAFDPRYFLTYEDFDLCREAKRLQYKVIYHPQFRCIDYNSRSFVQKPARWNYRIFSKGVYTYFRKWGAWYHWMMIALCIPLGYVARFLLKKKKDEMLL